MPYIQSGDTINFPTVSAIPADTVILITGASGTLIGVTKADTKANSDAIVHLRGVFEQPKLSTDVVIRGQRLYWDTVNSRMTTTAASWKIIGYAQEPAGNGDTTARVRLIETGQ